MSKIKYNSMCILLSFNVMVAREFTAGVKMSDGNWTGMIGQMARGVSIAFSRAQFNLTIVP